MYTDYILEDRVKDHPSKNSQNTKSRRDCKFKVLGTLLLHKDLHTRLGTVFLEVTRKLAWQKG